MPDLKLVLGGDGAVGKTCLMITRATGKFPSESVPTVFEEPEDYVTAVAQADGSLVTLQLWDRAGRLDVERLRPLFYPDTHVHVVCFSLVGHSSFDSVRSTWIPELEHHSPGVPVVLVGTKLDLRLDGPMLARLKSNRDVPITFEQGARAARELGCVAYRECAATVFIVLDHLSHFSAVYHPTPVTRAVGMRST